METKALNEECIKKKYMDISGRKWNKVRGNVVADEDMNKLYQVF